tara:strand:+ start:250 stop:630 length:381 start_codon:yes stop_codon:yes gene_type:complete
MPALTVLLVVVIKVVLVVEPVLEVLPMAEVQITHLKLVVLDSHLLLLVHLSIEAVAVVAEVTNKLLALVVMAAVVVAEATDKTVLLPQQILVEAVVVLALMTAFTKVVMAVQALLLFVTSFNRRII